MPRYARIKGGTFEGLKDFPSQPPNIAHKNVVWLPCPVVSPPSFDPKTESRSGPTYTVNETEVTEGWTVTSLTAPQIAAQKAAAVAAINEPYMFIIKALHDLDTRSRAKEKPPLGQRTLAQYEAYVAGL